MLRLILVASLAVSALAQSISSQCLTALAQVAANPDASKCLNLPALGQVFTTPADASIVKPIDTWLSGLCGRASCSDATLDAIAAIVGPACPAELTALGFTPANFATELKAVYPVFRKIICLKHGNTFCITEFLTGVEAKYGTLTLTKGLQLSTNPPADFPKELLCSNCEKAAYNILAQASPTDAKAAKPKLEQMCGANFVDGQNPPDISQGAA